MRADEFPGDVQHADHHRDQRQRVQRPAEGGQRRVLVLRGRAVGAITYLIVHGIGGFLGSIIGFGLLVAVASAIYLQSRKTKVDHNNVNAEWKGDLTAGLDEDGKPGIAGAPYSYDENSDAAPPVKKAGTP